jgi:predicted transcriptional regulator
MHNNDSAALKHLQTQRNEAVAAIKVAREQQREIGLKISSLQQNINHLDREIRELTTKKAKPVVSEHAMLRYFERVLHYDLDEIAEKVMPTPVAEQIQTVRSGKFPVGRNGDSFRLVVKDNVVMTLLAPEDKE